MKLSRRSFAILAAAAPVGLATRYVSANVPTFGSQTMASPEASPQASPQASPAATGNTVTVNMVDIAFEEKELTIPANTDVTVNVVNKGVTTHSFVINDHKNEGKPNLNIRVEEAAGQSSTTTINAPAGDYYYWCDVPGHEAAGMFGTLHVQ